MGLQAVATLPQEPIPSGDLHAGSGMGSVGEKLHASLSAQAPLSCVAGHVRGAAQGAPAPPPPTGLGTELVTCLTSQPPVGPGGKED